MQLPEMPTSFPAPPNASDAGGGGLCGCRRRLLGSFAARLSENAAMWGRVVAPFSEWVAQTLRTPSRKPTSKDQTVPTRLTAPDNRRSRRTVCSQQNTYPTSQECLSPQSHRCSESRNPMQPIYARDATVRIPDTGRPWHELARRCPNRSYAGKTMTTMRYLVALFFF